MPHRASHGQQVLLWVWIKNPLPSKLLGFLRATGRGEAEKQPGVPVFRDLGNDKPYMMFTSCPLTWLSSKGIPVSSNPNVYFAHPTPSAQLPLQGCQEEVHTVGSGRL